MTTANKISWGKVTIKGVAYAVSLASNQYWFTKIAAGGGYWKPLPAGVNVEEFADCPWFATADEATRRVRGFEPARYASELV